MLQMFGGRQITNLYTKCPVVFGCRSRLGSTIGGSGVGKTSGYVIEPTTMKIQNFDVESQNIQNIPPLISKYSTKGFKIQGNKLYGSVAILPKTFFSWKVRAASEITIESLQLFTVVEPKIELLVVGTGVKIERLSQDVRDYLRKHNISLEVLDTPNACSTFNFLLEEGRMTAAALIPPTDIPLY